MSTTTINPGLVFADQPPGAAHGPLAVAQAWFLRTFGTLDGFARSAATRLAGWAKAFWARLTSLAPSKMITGLGYLAVSTRTGYALLGKAIHAGLVTVTKSVGLIARAAHKAIDLVGRGVTWAVSTVSPKAAEHVGGFFAKFSAKRRQAAGWLREKVGGVYQMAKAVFTSDPVVSATTGAAAAIGATQVATAAVNTFGIGTSVVSAIASAPVLGPVFSFVAAGGWPVLAALLGVAAVSSVATVAWDMIQVRRENSISGQVEALFAEGPVEIEETVPEIEQAPKARAPRKPRVTTAAPATKAADKPAASTPRKTTRKPGTTRAAKVVAKAMAADPANAELTPEQIDEASKLIIDTAVENSPEIAAMTSAQLVEAAKAAVDPTEAELAEAVDDVERELVTAGAPLSDEDAKKVADQIVSAVRPRQGKRGKKRH